MPMEPSSPTPDDPPRTDWRALGQLRDRVETAAREIERLRTENAALAQRLVELGNRPDAVRALSGEDPAAIKARIQGFIDTIDELLRETPADDTADAA